ncbi:MAG: hypothetical protein IPN38_15535 [Flavobacteriales bacterium]|nr:hypothetical protein [Flavobacteriales bacterium]
MPLIGSGYTGNPCLLMVVRTLRLRLRSTNPFPAQQCVELVTTEWS